MDRKQQSLGEVALDKLLQCAQYELDQDPYRGMMMLSSSSDSNTEARANNNNSLDKNPWTSQCLFVETLDNDTDDSSSSPVSSATRKVFAASHCTCPSLVRWTEQHEVASEQAAKKKRRKRTKSATTTSSASAVGTAADAAVDVLGHRPLDRDFTCPCDYNPFCLGSLGGVMDQLLEQAAQKVQEREEEEEEASSLSVTSVAPSLNQVIDLNANDDDDSGSGECCTSSTRIGVTTMEQQTDEKRPAISRSNTQSPSIMMLPSNVCYESFDEAASSTVEQGMHRPSRVYTTQEVVIATDEMMQVDPEKKHAVYSTLTAEEMRKVRKTCDIDEGPVRSYVEGTILSQLDRKGGGTALSYNHYMAELRNWHNSLAFSNPLLTTRPSPKNNVDDDSNNKLTIAIPPGIKNLGATCYLNTQFQCLARMTAFLNGIFSWTPSQENHRWNSVLSSMQLLFARMVHGAEATLTTQEFSNALGLETGEMQDPNEFARLLFEQMHESFQQCADGGSKDNRGGEQEDLSMLLPKLFRGVTTYETVCLTCNNVTERSENFMDVNLPIVHPSEISPRKKSGQLKITDSFVGSTEDTNVQYCLNRYTCAEELSGENQYSCECCGTKQDALRTIKFRELPPLLNVQLSRYVFDRKKLAKKKLTDKVLLPSILTVPLKGQDTDSRYLLCAVMKHRGNSAYQGHYIAEAMDWQSGTWFEFNDELVTVLEGPSCSYSPEDLENVDRKKVKGSQDAYNMYYAEESFLAKCASNFVTTRAILDQTTVLGRVSDEREHRYSTLTEMCLHDAKVASRLMRRRVGLAKKLSGEMLKEAERIQFNMCPLASGNETDVVHAQPPVWVDGNILRRFLSCDETNRTSPISTAGPLLKHKHLLCEHGVGLHPRVARRGKLLPRPLYDALVSLMLGERRMINKVDDSELSESAEKVDDDAVNDCIITPNHNMYCKDCADSYKNVIRKKIDALSRLRQLHNLLDSKTKMTLEIEDDSSTDSEPVNETVFLVSTKFVTKFRARVSNIFKAAHATELQSNGRNQGSKKLKTYGPGLDAVDLSDLDQNIIASSGRSDPGDDLDRCVNSAITCEHGKCNSPHARSVRRVSGDVWRLLLSLFPDAISLEIGKETPNRDVRCELCEDEETKKEEIADKLRLWSESATSSPLLREIAKRKRSVQEISFMLLDTDSDDETMDRGPANDVLLVHSKDIESWRLALRAVKKHAAKATSTLTEILIDQLFSSREGSSDKRNEDCQNVFSKIYANMTSLVCCKHSLPIERAVFKPGLDTEFPCISLVNSCVEALSPGEYAAFIGSIYDLGMLLYSDDTEAPSTESNEDVFKSTSRRVTPEMLRQLQSHRHTRLQSPLRPIGHESASLDFDTLLKCHLASGICRDADCNGDFEVENAQYMSKGKNDQQATNHVDLSSDTADKTEETVVAKGDKKFPLRSFQIAGGTDFDTAALSILGLPASGDAAANLQPTTVRRSSRKRKSTYPNGNVLREDIVMVCSHYNIAAVRLFLYEKYQGFAVDHGLTLIIPGRHDNHVDMTVEETEMSSQLSNAEEEHIAIDLEYSWNERPLEEIVKTSCEEVNLAPPPSLQEVFLCWKDKISSEGKNGFKKSANGTPIPNESLMDALLEMTNVSSTPDTTPTGKKSSRRTERGFQGTLLHSTGAPAAAAPTTVEEDKTSDDVSSSIGNEKSNDKENQTHGQVDVPAHNDGAEDKPSAVIVVDSDDEAAYQQAGNKRRRTSTPPDENTNTSAVVSPSSKMEAHPRTLRSTNVNPKEEAIVNKLIDALANDSGAPVGGMGASLSRMRQAAQWAINRNFHDTSISILADVALAKYFEESPMM